jgi:hypothetical protein
MWLTHRFGSVETLERARYWLTQHGFEVARSDFAEHDETRLSMSLDLSEVSAALALIDSIERTDSRGWPGLFELPTTLHLHAGDSQTPPKELGPGLATSPIHWQSHLEHPSSDPTCCKICDYMLSRGV